MIDPTYIREPFPATHMLALVWLLTSVCPDVDRESTSLNEALPASWRRAGVRTLIGVNPVVPLKVGLPIEALCLASASAFRATEDI